MKRLDKISVSGTAYYAMSQAIDNKMRPFAWGTVWNQVRRQHNVDLAVNNVVRIQEASRATMVY
jgi:hypothetical protein